VSALVVADKVGCWYGQVVGLSELSLTIEGGVTGLVGPNGAGKSTFLKLIAGEIKPSRGRIEVMGLAPFANREYFRRVGFVPQQEAIYEDMSGFEVVRFLMQLHGFDAREAGRRANSALDRVGLGDARRRGTAGYSKGMRQRTKIAQAIAHDPELIVADEPLEGLDPIGRAEIQRLFAEIAAQGAHVIVSSHVLHEVESLTPNIVLVHRGRLVAQGPVREVRRLLSRHPRRVVIHAREARRLSVELMALESVRSIELSSSSSSATVETSEIDLFLTELTRVAARAKVGITSLDSPDASLEAVFDYLVG
jgi:ABC-2 type transport system ATP-binding protein